MSSSSPESCSASNDFEENSVGRYGIQPYQFEPRDETVPSVEEARSARSSSGEDEDMEFEEEERNPRLQNSDWYVTKSCMFLAATRFFVNQRFSSSQQLKFAWQSRRGINLLTSFVCECSFQCLCHLLGYFSFSSKVKTNLNYHLI